MPNNVRTRESLRNESPSTARALAEIANGSRAPRVLPHMNQLLDARQVRRTVTRSGLHAFEAAYAPNSLLHEHLHVPAFFTYVIRGDYVEEVGRTSRLCHRGAVVFHGQRETHTNIVGGHGTASLNVEIPDETWRELTAGPVTQPDLVGRVLSGDVEWKALAVWREFHQDDSASVLGLDEAVAVLCAAVRQSQVRRAFEPHQRLDRCAEYLRARIDGSPTLTEVARVAGVHPMHLAKLFRKRFGYSMGEFLRRERIAWACDQLARSTGTIGMIAVRAGFADHAHFTRTFRRVTACSPRWYRQCLQSTTSPGF